MSPELNTICDAALKLPPEQQAILIRRLSENIRPRRGGGDITKFFGALKGGDPRGADNDKIDADLARAYADDHAPEN